VRGLTALPKDARGDGTPKLMGDCTACAGDINPLAGGEFRLAVRWWGDCKDTGRSRNTSNITCLQV